MFDTTLFFKSLAGAGLLVFGLHIFEESLKALGGRHLRHILENQTKNLRRGILAGTWISAVTTSSTFVSLLLVAFVGAGLLGLHNAIGVVLGANIGTTLNSLWVAYLGFGELKISKFAMPIIAFGGIIFMVTKKEKWLHIASMCIGIGLLFVGLDFMKASVETFAKSFDLRQYTNLRAFGGIGGLVTALLHSQAAMSVITLTALNAGIIGIKPAFAIIIGANIGTTMTAITASISGTKAHKQIALSHFLQNIIAAVLGILLFNQFYWFCNEWLATLLNYQGNPVLATAWFNTVFNIVTALPFMIFPHQFAKLIEKLTHQDETKKHQYAIESIAGIGPVSQTIGIQLDMMLRDSNDLHSSLKQFIYALMNKEVQGDTITSKIFEKQVINEYYDQIKKDVNLMYQYLLPLQKSTLTAQDVTRLNRVKNILEYTMDSAEVYNHIAEQVHYLCGSSKKVIQELYENICIQIEHHITSNTPSPSLHDMQKSFLPAIQEGGDSDEDIDVAMLLALQHELLFAHQTYEKLIKNFS